jgi:hypothetical protein
MPTNWKSFVEASQAKAFTLPEGWDVRDKIAEDLGCSPDNVRKLLGPAIKSGAVEFKQLPIWDKVLKKVRSVACYRRIRD